MVPYQQRQETLARLGLGTTLGMTAGQLFGGIFTDTLGWRSAFVLMTVLFAVVSVLLGRQLHHVPPVPAAHEGGGFFRQLKNVSHDSWARTILIIALIEGASIFGVLAITASHLHHNLGISLTLAGGATALYGLGGMAYMASAKLAIRRFGEVGLAGEVRPAPRGQERLREAAKLGFSEALIPRANAPKKPIEGLRVHAIDRIDDALQVLRQWNP